MRPALRARGLPALALMFNALAWGISWWPLRQLEGLGLHPLWTTAAVFGSAAVLIACLRPRALRQVLGQPQLWTIALAAGATNAAFNWAVTIGDVVRVVLLFYLMPLWTVLLARWLLHEPFSGAILLRVALALGGAVAVLWPASGAGLPLPLPLPQSLPDLLGVAGGFFFALNNVLLRREAAREDSSRALAMFLGGGLVAAGAAALLSATQGVAWPPAPAWPWVGGVLALTLLFLMSNFSLQYGASNLPANVTAIIMMSEVLFATMSSVWLASAVLTAQVLWGGGMILLAALLALRPEKHRPSTHNEENRMTATTTSTSPLDDFAVQSITGEPFPLAEQRGKVLLIVNTASACGFTPQFAGLQQLWERYRTRGLVVLGFPSNEFGGQDPGNDSEIASFCKINYGVSFPMMSKVQVNGSHAHPLWQWLTREAPGLLGTRAVKWNFTKFLVGRDGRVLKRYAPTDTPESLAADIETALAA